MSDGTARVVPGSAEAKPVVTVYDRSVALHHVGDDDEILAQLVQMFFEQAPEHVTKAENALRDHDAKTLEREAHSLKGTAATLGMPGLRDAAYAVERIGADGALEGAAPAVTEMRTALDAVVAHLRSPGA